MNARVRESFYIIYYYYRRTRSRDYTIIITIITAVVAVVVVGSSVYIIVFGQGQWREKRMDENHRYYIVLMSRIGFIVKLEFDAMLRRQRSFTRL